ncbi:RNA polymerase sigma factor [Deminuibacter soli]|uniref:Sigma-70 family RNA polymerase sigma factor n=1 Tax=Deminuibacter soli TaxID=2291815 RepID=A0A3E1NQN7_9BACT|nr:hypothetical protein [Deminuibacter soli]RFM30242.1 hypothetical protein DXN05_04540 [Deminuibacter soli]
MSTIIPANPLPFHDFFGCIAAGDSEAFQSFVDRYCFTVFAFATQITGGKNAATIMALTIEIFLFIWNNRQQLAEEEKPSGFVYNVIFGHLHQFLEEQNDQHRIRLLQTMQPKKRAIAKAIKQQMWSAAQPAISFNAAFTGARQYRQFKKLAKVPAISFSRVHTGRM